VRLVVGALRPAASGQVVWGEAVRPGQIAAPLRVKRCKKKLFVAKHAGDEGLSSDWSGLLPY
jgi:hypothetical protein